MNAPRALKLLDAGGLVAGSRISVGKRLRVRGVPAVLLGVAALIVASGASKAMQKAMTILPESLREARSFWLAIRDEERPRLS